MTMTDHAAPLTAMCQCEHIDHGHEYGCLKSIGNRRARYDYYDDAEYPPDYLVICDDCAADYNLPAKGV